MDNYWTVNCGGHSVIYVNADRKVNSSVPNRPWIDSGLTLLGKRPASQSERKRYRDEEKGERGGHRQRSTRDLVKWNVSLHRSLAETFDVQFGVAFKKIHPRWCQYALILSKTGTDIGTDKWKDDDKAIHN
ncbi:unnamed protein product [Xylocopa violacea]|uniref:Uncharacterized protein n=1 Tax=Xylocopa violacea TaxID=135666 RepID=A0ABP1PFH1_XYLVO